MSKNNAILLAAIAVIVLIGVFIFTADAPAPTPTPAPSDGGSQSAPVSPQTVTVAYTSSGFSPKSITIKKGDTVVFKNETPGNAFWVASDPHPIHNGYPTKGGCISSTFDSCARVEPGQSFSFVFDVVGSWGYHSHINPSHKGTVVVQ